MKEIAETLEKHHRGILPKSAYSPDGNLYPSSILYGGNKSAKDRINRKKNREAEERGIEKIKEKAKNLKKEKIVLTTEDLKKDLKKNLEKNSKNENMGIYHRRRG